VDAPEVKLLADLILDVKRDVSDIKKDLSETKDMTKSNSVVLEEHARRSRASESRLDVQEEKLDKFILEMEPVKDHVKTVSLLTHAGVKILKVLAILASLVATIAGLLKLR
jgi:hypothetical protein